MGALRILIEKIAPKTDLMLAISDGWEACLQMLRPKKAQRPPIEIHTIWTFSVLEESISSLSVDPCSMHDFEYESISSVSFEYDTPASLLDN